MMTIVFGPVPSRRLGKSVGINNIPPKICTYSCVYCQIGRTPTMQITRQAFFDPEEILRQVEQKLVDVETRKESVDYLAFVPDGEPTLDRNLGQEIEQLKRFGIPIAVITNASLLGDKEVREAVCQADWVSVKIDAVDRSIWRTIDRPYERLKLKKIWQGIVAFARTFKGMFTTETVLVQTLNDAPDELHAIADRITELHPDICYLSLPTRPPAEKWVMPATEETLHAAYHIFCEKGLQVEYLIGHEGNAFAYTGNVEEDLLSITAVHPMREDAVRALLSKAHADWHIVEKLQEQQKLRAMIYQNKTFYIRTLPHRETKKHL